MPGKVVIVGGANVDIGGFSSVPLVHGDSNPGRVHMSPGGVGRNIAENCVRMGLEVNLITAIGTDPNGTLLQNDCAQRGIALDGSLITGEAGTSVYLFIDDADGDMDCAVNDMAIQEQLTPAFMQQRMAGINASSAVVLDANLPAETLAYLAEHCTVPVFADAVSMAKAPKLIPVLKHIDYLKVNRLEAELLTGKNISSEADVRSACAALIRLGVKNVFLTLGAQGAACACADDYVRVTAVSDHVVNATGAGDAFTAALVWAYTQGCGLKESCIAGMAASMIAVESQTTVSTDMTRENLLNRIHQIQA